MEEGTQYLIDKLNEVIKQEPTSIAGCLCGLAKNQIKFQDSEIIRLKKELAEK